MTGPNRSDLIAGFKNGGPGTEVVDLGLNVVKSALHIVETHSENSVCKGYLPSNWRRRYNRCIEDRLKKYAHPKT